MQRQGENYQITSLCISVAVTIDVRLVALREELCMRPSPQFRENDAHFVYPTKCTLYVKHTLLQSGQGLAWWTKSQCAQGTWNIDCMQFILQLQKRVMQHAWSQSKGRSQVMPTSWHLRVTSWDLRCGKGFSRWKNFSAKWRSWDMKCNKLTALLFCC